MGNNINEPFYEIRYSRNSLFISIKEQHELIKSVVFFAGLDTGSVVAEAAVRLGFKRINLWDEADNYLAYNYEAKDRGQKAVALKKRLEAINEELDIAAPAIGFRQLKKRLKEYVRKKERVILINDLPDKKELDVFCLKNDIHVIHPFNLGDNGGAFIVKKGDEKVFEEEGYYQIKQKGVAIGARLASAHAVRLMYIIANPNDKVGKNLDISYQPAISGASREKKLAALVNEIKYHKNPFVGYKFGNDNTSVKGKKIKDINVFFAGVGLGSVIAETAVRMGFRKFVFVDLDDVEISNLNRQNFTQQDVRDKKGKVKAIIKRLRAIAGDELQIDEVRSGKNGLIGNVEFEEIETKYNEGKDISSWKKDAIKKGYTIENNYITDDIDIAINALDYDTNAPNDFDKACLAKKIPVIHPANRNWAAAAFVVVPKSSTKLTDILKNNQVEKDDKKGTGLTSVVNFLNKAILDEGYDIQWYLDAFQALLDGRKKNEDYPVSQLSAGANLAAAQTVKIMLDYLGKTGEKLNGSPHVYYNTVKVIEKEKTGGKEKKKNRKKKKRKNRNKHK